MSGIMIEEKGQEVVRAVLLKAKDEDSNSTRSVELHQHPQGSVLAQIPGGTHVTVLSRDASGEWVKVVHITGSGANQESQVGWIASNQVQEMRFREMPFDRMNLQVASADQAPEDDVAALLATKRQELWRSLRGYAWLFIGSAAIIGVFIAYLVAEAAGSADTIDFTVAGMMMGLIGGILGGTFIYIVVQSLADRPLRREIERLSERIYNARLETRRGT